MHQVFALFVLSNAPKKSRPSSSYSFILKGLFFGLRAWSLNLRA